MPFNPVTSQWEREFPNGTWVHPPHDRSVVGLVTDFEIEDGEYHLVVPPDSGDPLTEGWVEVWAAHEVTIADPPDFVSATPSYIFMVIQPKRQISTYANLEALILETNEGSYSPKAVADLRRAAAEAVADPDTDVRLHPTRSIFLRFTQVKDSKHE